MQARGAAVQNRKDDALIVQKMIINRSVSAASLGSTLQIPGSGNQCNILILSLDYYNKSVGSYAPKNVVQSSRIKIAAACQNRI